MLYGESQRKLLETVYPKLEFGVHFSALILKRYMYNELYLTGTYDVDF